MAVTMLGSDTDTKYVNLRSVPQKYKISKLSTRYESRKQNIAIMKKKRIELQRMEKEEIDLQKIKKGMTEE